MSPALDAALALAARSLDVFPVVARGKAPALAQPWGDVSTTDPDRVRELFAHRALNIGVDCGRSGIVVLDEDRPGAIVEVADELGVPALVSTFSVSTGRGTHLYFAQRDAAPIGCSRGAFTGRGVDVKGRGGYVVGPGSVHESGRVYTVIDPSPIAAMPGWLADALAPQPLARGSAAPSVQAGAGSALLRAQVRGVLDAVLRAPQGNIRNVTYWAARRLFEHVACGALGQPEAEAMLLDAARAAGLTEDEAERHAIRSARKAVLDQ